MKKTPIIRKVILYLWKSDLSCLVTSGPAPIRVLKQFKFSWICMLCSNTAGKFSSVSSVYTCNLPEMEIGGGGLTLLPVSNSSWVLRAMKTNKLACLNGTVCCSLNALSMLPHAIGTTFTISLRHSSRLMRHQPCMLLQQCENR